MTPLLNSLMVRAADAPVIKPAVELGTPLLLTIAAVGIALLLVMIIRFKIQAFRGPADRQHPGGRGLPDPAQGRLYRGGHRRGWNHGQGGPADCAGRDSWPDDRGLRRRAVPRGALHRKARRPPGGGGAYRRGLPRGHPGVLRGGHHRAGADRLRVREDRKGPPGQVRPADGRHHAVHPRGCPAAPRNRGGSRRVRRRHRPHYPDLAAHLHPAWLPVLLGGQHHEQQGLRAPPRRQSPGGRVRFRLPGPRQATTAPVPSPLPRRVRP